VTPVFQTTFGDGSDGSEPGNCQAACIATLLDLSIEEVPNFAKFGVKYWDEQEAFLAKHGLWLMYTKEEPCTSSVVHYIGSGISPRGLRHAVIMLDEEIVHDPHPSQAGLVGKPDRFGILCKIL